MRNLVIRSFYTNYFTTITFSRLIDTTVDSFFHFDLLKYHCHQSVLPTVTVTVTVYFLLVVSAEISVAVSSLNERERLSFYVGVAAFPRYIYFLSWKGL